MPEEKIQLSEAKYIEHTHISNEKKSKSESGCLQTNGEEEISSDVMTTPRKTEWPKTWSLTEGLNANQKTKAVELEALDFQLNLLCN